MAHVISDKLLTQRNTCFTCPNFSNFHESNGRGWCELFDHQARAHHEMTNDCVVSSQTLIQQREISSVIDTKGEKELITIEFATNIHPDETEYSYQHPQFVFGNEVEIKGSFIYPTITYKVCALELLENKTPSGKLLYQPSWKYKISDGQQTYWKDETALVLAGDSRQIKTTPVFTTEPLESVDDQPHSPYKVGSLVKVIDPAEDHTEWPVFEVVECKHNQSLYRSTESYLNEPQWYYRLVSHVDASSISKSLWVREDEICQFDMAHNISTQYIF